MQQGLKSVILGPKWKGPRATLTHRWPMDAQRTTTTSIVDVVGSVNGVNTGGGVSNGTGPFNGQTARAFNGSSYVILAANPLPAYTAAHSVFCWGMVTNIANTGTAGTNQTMWDFSTDTSNGTRCTCIVTTGNLAISLIQAGTDVGANSSAQVWVNNTWAHVGYTYTGSTFTMYVNGVAVSMTNVGASGATVSGVQHIATKNAALAGNLTGNIFSMVTYARALTASEVMQLYLADKR